MIQIYTRTRNPATGKVELDAIAYVCIPHQIAIFHDKPDVVHLFMPEKEAKLLKSLKGIVSKGVGEEISKSEAAALFKEIARLFQLNVIVQEHDHLDIPPITHADNKPEISGLSSGSTSSAARYEPDQRTKNMLDAERHAELAAIAGVKFAVSYNDDDNDNNNNNNSGVVARNAPSTNTTKIAVVNEKKSDGIDAKQIDSVADMNRKLNEKVGSGASVVYRRVTPSIEMPVSSPIPAYDESGATTCDVHDVRSVFPTFQYDASKHMYMTTDHGTDTKIAEILEQGTFRVLASVKLYKKYKGHWLVIKEETASLSA